MSEDASHAVCRKPVWTLPLFCALFLLVVTTPAHAQNSLGAPGCGPDDQHFDVKTSKSQHPETKESPDQAVIYFLQDDREFQSIPKPVVRVGIDGSWIAATHGTSYLVTTVDPGEHHLCASWQTNVTIGSPKQSGALHFTAEPGQSYFFSARDLWFRDAGAVPMKFEPIDRDQGKLLISQFAFATSKPKT